MINKNKAMNFRKSNFEETLGHMIELYMIENKT